MLKNTAIWLCGAVLVAASASVSAQSFKVLRNFSGSTAPFAFGRLLCCGDTLYVATAGGGTSGWGSVFRINTDGSGYRVLKNFSAPVTDPSGVLTNSDGAQPMAGLVTDGHTLYGTTYEGGAFGKGTVFSLQTDGTGFTVLKHFSGSDGKTPYAELTIADNVLYGTTAGGGVSNKGAVFRLNTDGSDFTVLKSFTTNDGVLLLDGLALSDGTLYGTTYYGGSANAGTVFSMSTEGTGFTRLKEFTGADGAQPRFTLVLSGNSLYGTTEGSGDLSNSLVYRLSTDGTEYTILKTFPTPDPVTGTNSDGYYVRTGLAISGHTLYGTTRWGGYYDSGVVFAVNTDGSGFSVLKHFSALTGGGPYVNSDGAAPLPSLILSGGALYGTTESGGGAGQGTLFSLTIAPRIQVNDGSFGVRNNCFGFNVTGYSNQVVVAETCTNLANPLWLALQTNTLGAGPWYFSDPAWANYPRRCYRIRMQ
jgi:uncharacterized repeat protein (TIGR03803 family)